MRSAGRARWASYESLLRYPGGRARTGRAIILPFEGEAEALLLVRIDCRLTLCLGERCRERDGGESARYGAGQDKRRNRG
jgi:hypothetical protein